MDERRVGSRGRRPLTRFWSSALVFWTDRTAWQAWSLCALLLAIMAGQLVMQYVLNYWNRGFFDALEQRNAAALAHATMMFFVWVGLSTALAVLSVWTRMGFQRRWRRFLTRHLIKTWLGRGRYRLLGDLNGSNLPLNPEYRIAEDARVATDAPVDLVLALISSVLTVVIFSDILARIGGSISFPVAGITVEIPSYLAVSVVVYSGLVTGAMLFAGRRFVRVLQDQVQAEAAFRAAANIVRETGDGLVASASDARLRRLLWVGLHDVIEQWRRFCGQHMRVTLVTNTNSLVVPVVGLLLCVPKFLDGSMSLGEVTQAAAAFTTVQGALNWFVDNFQRMADWRAAATRVATLLLALDDLRQGGRLGLRHEETVD